MEKQSGNEWVRGAVIGAGSFGTVSAAMNKRNGHLFAVKSTHHSISSLQNEHHILQSLDSPYVVRCLGHDFTHENGLPTFNLFLEYMPGGSIADLLKKFQGRFEESIVRSYTRSILHGIHYLHSQGVVHCDIKASNILVAPSAIKLADFGSAKRMNGNATLPLSGTPLWMAPEVLNQQEQGPPSDIWSLGCTVLEMATGKPPWAHISHPLAAIYHIATTHDLPEFPRSISPQGRDFLEKCFRRDPKQRWTAAQLLTHPFLSNDPLPPEKEETPPLSPTSTLDFHRGALQPWDSNSSTFSETVSILSSYTNLPAETQGGGRDTQERRAVDEQCPRPSPRQRVLQLAAGGEMQRPNWFPSPSAQWIVVKSPQTNFSGGLNGSFPNELPSTKGDLEVNSEANNYAHRRSSTVQQPCLESHISIAQGQCASLYSTLVQPTRCHLPNFRLVTTDKINHAQELCATFSEFDSQDYGYCIFVGQETDPCGFHDQLIPSSQGEAVSLLYCGMCSVSLCCKMNMIKSHLYSSGRSDDSACNFSSKIIQIHFHCLHTHFCSARDLSESREKSAFTEILLLAFSCLVLSFLHTSQLKHDNCIERNIAS